MSTQVVQENQLLELLLQLKRTTPEQARAILNSQPQIAYALMSIMVNINAIDYGVVQRTLTAYGGGAAASSTTFGVPNPAAPLPVPRPTAPAIPSHLANHTSRGTTPPYPAPASNIPPHLAASTPSRQGTPTYPHQGPGYLQQEYPSQIPPTQPHYGGVPGPSQPGYNAPTPTRTPSYGSQQPTTRAPPAWHAALALIPEEQRPLLTRVANMTPQEIHALPPQERNSYIQLRATLGIPT